LSILFRNNPLAEDVWYEVRTAVNVGDPLFQLWWAAVLFYRVLREAKGRFRFEMHHVLEMARSLPIIFHSPFIIFNSRRGVRAWREWKMDN
jgi:hypothetical protein